MAEEIYLPNIRPYFFLLSEKSLQKKPVPAKTHGGNLLQNKLLLAIPVNICLG